MSQALFPATLLPALELSFASRYIFGSSLIWLLWDNLVTLDTEVDLIWSQGLSGTSLVFYINRYGVTSMLVALQYITSGLSPGLNLEKCQSVSTALLMGTAISSILVNGYMSYYYAMLWDRNRRASLAIVVVFFAAYMPGAALAMKSAVDYHKFVQYNGLLNNCFVTQQPPLMLGFWSFLVFFDACAMVIVVLNALNRPHHKTIDAFKALWNDGVLYFVTLLFIRVGNLICVTRLAPSQTVLQLFHIWALISILLSRFIFRVETVNNPRQTRVYVWNKDTEIFQMTNM